MSEIGLYYRSMKYFLIALIGALCVFTATSADIFELHFYYDSQKNILQFSQDQEPISRNPEKNISAVDFSEGASVGSFEFVFIDAEGFEIVRKHFAPKNGNFIVEVPYFSIATKLLVYKDGLKDPIIDQDMSTLVSCNGNKVCEFERGENIDTCLPDCASGNVTYSPETKAKVDAGNGIVRDPKTGSILLNDLRTTDASQNAPVGENPQSSAKPFWLTILFVVGLAGAAGAAVYFILRREE